MGLTAAKTMAMLLGIPLVTVNHVEAHIYACGMGEKESIYPSVGFVVSGGHTNLYDCRSASECQLIGGTIDDAAGEAFDKVAKILGLSYPGGPSIQNAARGGDRTKYKMPRPLLHSGQLDFSFSGLKTAVLYAARGVPGPNQLQETPADRVADLAASFQEAAVEVLVEKCRQALLKTDIVGSVLAVVSRRINGFERNSRGWRSGIESRSTLLDGVVYRQCRDGRHCVGIARRRSRCDAGSGCASGLVRHRA